MNEFNDESNVIDFAERVAAGQIAKAVPPEELEVITKDELVFTNDKSDQMIRQMFHMLYQMTYDNSLGLMHALNTETEKVETLIVGVNRTEDGYACFPIAKVLTDSEQGKYKSPDGAGNYV